MHFHITWAEVFFGCRQEDGYINSGVEVDIAIFDASGGKVLEHPLVETLAFRAGFSFSVENRRHRCTRLEVGSSHTIMVDVTSGDFDETGCAVCYDGPDLSSEFDGKF